MLTLYYLFTHFCHLGSLWLFGLFLIDYLGNVLGELIGKKLFTKCLKSFTIVTTVVPLKFKSKDLNKLLCFRFYSHSRNSILKPAETCDVLKGFILLICSILMCYIDTNMMYHLVKSQSVMKLYIFYNMLEVGDRLFSAFGQDTIDALFWTATEPRDRRREHLGVLPHLLFAMIYVCILFNRNINYSRKFQPIALDRVWIIYKNTGWQIYVFKVK